MSIEGFYCVVPEPFMPGEELECRIIIPVQCLSSCNEMLCMRGIVRVARLESSDLNGRFGIGCRIESYSIASISSVLLPQQAHPMRV